MTNMKWNYYKHGLNYYKHGLNYYKHEVKLLQTWSENITNMKWNYYKHEVKLLQTWSETNTNMKWNYYKHEVKLFVAPGILASGALSRLLYSAGDVNIQTP